MPNVTVYVMTSWQNLPSKNTTSTTFNYDGMADAEQNRAPKIYKIYGIKY